jgi:hypothetical protein
MSYNIDNLDIIDLGFNGLNHQQVVITVDSVNYDITDIILKTKHSVLKVEYNV